jgi:hypothetical protein
MRLFICILRRKVTTFIPIHKKKNSEKIKKKRKQQVCKPGSVPVREQKGNLLTCSGACH